MLFFTYLFKQKDTNFTKGGETSNYNIRMDTLEKNGPHELQIIYLKSYKSREEALIAEQELHTLLWPYLRRRRGKKSEWYELPKLVPELMSNPWYKKFIKESKIS